MNNKPSIKKLDHLAWLLDSSIRIPGTQWRIGLDGIIGLIPGIGDIIAGTLSGYIILQAVRAGASLPVIVHMIFNVILESIVGTIPIFGDIFDFAFKANLRNLNLLHNYLDNPAKGKQKSLITVTLVVLLLIFLLMLLIYLTGAILRVIIGLVI